MQLTTAMQLSFAFIVRLPQEIAYCTARERGQHCKKMLFAKHRCFRLLLADCGCFSVAAETAADRQSAYNCAIGQSPGITVKFTTSTVASILTDPSPDLNLR